MTWKVGQEVVHGELLCRGEVRGIGRGLVERVYQDGGCKALGQRWRGDGYRWGSSAWAGGEPLRTAVDWEAKARRHVELAQADAARLADAKRRTAALNRITAALRDASAEQVEALAGEIGARAPTLGTLSPLSWDVRIDGDRQAIEPLDASRAREDFGNWRAHLAVVHHAECADADKHGEPRPKPPTLELVVEVVVDRWEP